MTTRRRVGLKITHYADAKELGIVYGPVRVVRVEPIPVDEDMLLKAHAEFVRLRAFLKAHDFLDGPKDRKNPYIGESHYSPPQGVPDPDPPDFIVEILVHTVAKTLSAEPSIKVRDMWGRLDRRVTWTRFRDGPESIWAKAHALAGMKRRRGPKKGPRKK
jgi:hypothetical protein